MPESPLAWPGRGGPWLDYISDPPDGQYRAQKKHSLVILGSTGSVGKNAFAIARANPESFQLTGLACATNVEKLASQAIPFGVPHLAVLNEPAAEKLRSLLPSAYNPEILIGAEGFARLASLPEADCVVSAQVGAAGLVATLAAALAGKVIHLANKESMVLAGNLARRICAKTGAAILPVDSEHHAIFQCLAGRGQNARSLILTASGGPFRNKSAAEIASVDARAALKHPTWNMGAKISVDSATMMNKGLELIEAMRLFGVDSGRIEILVHPQSIVHSLVRFADNSLLAQLALPDMRLPIAACMAWPKAELAFIPPLDLALASNLAFDRPDASAFPCLGLARQAADYEPDAEWEATGFNPACVVLNAANETAVAMFLNGECGFLEIATRVDRAMRELIRGGCQRPGKMPGLAMTVPAQALALAGIIADLDLAARKVARRPD